MAVYSPHSQHRSTSLRSGAFQRGALRWCVILYTDISLHIVVSNSVLMHQTCYLQREPGECLNTPPPPPHVLLLCLYLFGCVRYSIHHSRLISLVTWPIYLHKTQFVLCAPYWSFFMNEWGYIIINKVPLVEQISPNSMSFNFRPRWSNIDHLFIHVSLEYYKTCAVWPSSDAPVITWCLFGAKSFSEPGNYPRPWPHSGIDIRSSSDDVTRKLKSLSKENILYFFNCVCSRDINSHEWVVDMLFSQRFMW